MDINGAENNGFLAEKDPIFLEEQKAYADIQNFMSMDSALLQSKNDCDSPCVEPVPERFLPEGEFGPETDVDGIPVPFEVANKDIIADVANSVDLENFKLELDFLNGQKHTSDEIEEEASSVSADPVDLSEEQAEPEAPNVNGTAGEPLHFDAPTETGDLIGSVEQEDAVPILKAELNENELAPLKSIDEPIVSDLLGADSVVDNKLIDQLDSFGISDAIRRQLIEQTVPGSALNHEQDEDDDDGQLMEEKHSEFEGDGDGVEKGDLHHEKAFDSDIANDQHVKQDDDAGCCEESEEDEWDYVKPQESIPLEETVEHVNSNAFVAEEELPVERQIEEDETHEIEQHQHGDPADEQEEQEEQEEQQEEKPAVEELYQEQEREGEQFDATAVVEPNTSETPVDILGDNTESTVSDSTKEVDDVIIDGGEAKEVVNLLNDDLNEDVPQPTAIEPVCDTSVITAEDSSAASPVPSDSVNMEASMYGGSVAEQPVSPDTPVSPVEAFQAQQQQQQEFSADKDMFGSGLEDTLSPTGTEELHEKHLYEAEEKTMFQGDAAGGDLMQQGAPGDLGWQLNPEAKEFVPVVSPTSEEPASVFAPTRMLEHESFKLREDAIVAQSPRKGTAPSMEDLDLPAEREFQTEMDKRPHEFEATVGGGDGDQPSPLSPNPFNQLDDQTMLPGNGFDLINGGEVLQPEEVDLLSTVKSDPDPFGVSDNAPSEDLEILNKVQELPVGDEEEQQQEALINPQHSEPVQGAMFGQEEQRPDLMEPETYSAKEEQYVEQKETVDDYEFVEKPSDLVDPYNSELEKMDKVAEETVAAQAYAAQTAAFDMFGVSQPTPTTEETVPMETDEEPKQVQQENLMGASVYDPEPLVLATQEASQAPSEPEPSPEVVAEPVPASAASEVVAEPPKEQQTVEPEQPVPEEQHKESEKLTEENKAVVESAAAGVAVATAAVAAAAVAATATAASKTAAKPKAPSAAATAKKAGPTTTTATKTSKDVAAKSAPAASRVGGGAAAPAAMKEARPASATSKAPLAAKKPATDAAKTATTKTTTAASSVAAARTKAAATGPSSTTKPASASSTTRTAAPRPASTGTTTAAKPSSRLSTTGTTTRTVTSRPSSAISTSSVPSKPASATTTTAAKRTVATKITNGTTTTDGVTKSTKTSSTTTSSTASRMGVTRTTGTGTAAAKPASTLAAKKPLDTKPAAATKTTATSGTKPSTTTRTSLAPKTTATSPAVRKVQQNGVAKKPTATSPNPGAKKVAVSAKKPEEEPAKTNTSTTPTPTTTTTIETNGNAHENEQAMVDSPSPQPAADQLLVPIPQAM
ncbi:AGAP002149-PB-like protein [Anopheles sinensis]|uniref:AGAP002149-PB-like protein n=1 Tax=Anopheles sinensis TaxID=74873 RepID=A0A084WS94_ANOSI|nr:AGAP002149-PB-like protein [Anopheles sinensis]